MKKQFFMIDFANKTISGSKNALRKANDTSSREYAELSEKMTLHTLMFRTRNLSAVSVLTVWSGFLN